MRHFSAAIALFTAFAFAGEPVFAGSPIPQNGGTTHVKAGVKSRIRVYFNCNPGHALPGISGMAEHGTIEVTTGTQTRCNIPDLPVVFVFYTPQAGFTGVDDISLYASRFPTSISLIVQ